MAPYAYVSEARSLPIRRGVFGLARHSMRWSLKHARFHRDGIEVPFTRYIEELAFERHPLEQQHEAPVRIDDLGSHGLFAEEFFSAWTPLTSLTAIIYLPYRAYVQSLAEYQAAGVPILLPSLDLLVHLILHENYTLYDIDVDAEGVTLQRSPAVIKSRGQPVRQVRSTTNISRVRKVEDVHWLKSCLSQMEPYTSRQAVIFFSSLDDLADLLVKHDFDESRRQAREEYTQNVKEAARQWKHTFDWLEWQLTESEQHSLADTHSRVVTVPDHLGFALQTDTYRSSKFRAVQNQ